jgi:hypothetical protein
MKRKREEDKDNSEERKSKTRKIEKEKTPREAFVICMTDTLLHFFEDRQLLGINFNLGCWDGFSYRVPDMINKYKEHPLYEKSKRVGICNNYGLNRILAGRNCYPEVTALKLKCEEIFKKHLIKRRQVWCNELEDQVINVFKSIFTMKNVMENPTLDFGKWGGYFFVTSLFGEFIEKDQKLNSSPWFYGILNSTDSYGAADRLITCYISLPSYVKETSKKLKIVGTNLHKKRLEEIRQKFEKDKPGLVKKYKESVFNAVKVQCEVESMYTTHYLYNNVKSCENILNNIVSCNYRSCMEGEELTDELKDLIVKTIIKECEPDILPIIQRKREKLLSENKSFIFSSILTPDTVDSLVKNCETIKEYKHKKENVAEPLSSHKLDGILKEYISLDDEYKKLKERNNLIEESYSTIILEHDSFCNCEDGGDYKYYIRKWENMKHTLTLPEDLDICSKCDRISSTGDPCEKCDEDEE